MADKGLLIVLSGPSGAGKGAVRQGLLERDPAIKYGVSLTTRPPRPGEIDGVSYHFVSKAEFQHQVKTGGLVEWAEVYGNHYGTPRVATEELLAAGSDVILEKDIQGAMVLKRQYPDAVFVFILPPSLAELNQRIHRRGTESLEARRQRLANVSMELTYLDRYDYVVVNDSLPEAVDRLAAIITAEKCRVSRHPEGMKWLREKEGAEQGENPTQL